MARGPQHCLFPLGTMQAYSVLRGGKILEWHMRMLVPFDLKYRYNRQYLDTNALEPKKNVLHIRGVVLIALRYSDANPARLSTH